MANERLSLRLSRFFLGGAPGRAHSLGGLNPLLWVGVITSGSLVECRTVEPPDAELHVRWCGRSGARKLTPYLIAGRTASGMIARGFAVYR
jgi:hypothetical protein